ncbi:MAG: hypothetical protein IKP48_08330 [Bacteroidaceae bacterium]|nr:hypothetical protein [Bacteroidaceae bacterium]
MSEKFPYGYDLNAYIDKAFEQMKEDFPWATRDMIAKHTYLGIVKVGDEYQYVSYHYQHDGKLKPYPEDIDCDKFIRRLASGHEWELEAANPVKESINVPSSTRCSHDWFLEIYRIQKHELGGYSAYVQAGNRSAGGSRTFFIPASYFKLSWEEFLDKYMELVPPGPFYVDKEDLENAEGVKEFLGF